MTYTVNRGHGRQLELTPSEQQALREMRDEKPRRRAVSGSRVSRCCICGRDVFTSQRYAVVCGGCQGDRINTGSDV